MFKKHPNIFLLHVASSQLLRHYLTESRVVSTILWAIVESRPKKTDRNQKTTTNNCREKNKCTQCYFYSQIYFIKRTQTVKTCGIKRTNMCVNCWIMVKASVAQSVHSILCTLFNRWGSSDESWCSGACRDRLEWCSGAMKHMVIVYPSEQHSFPVSHQHYRASQFLTFPVTF